MKLATGIFLALSCAAAQASDFVAVGNARSEIKIDKTRSEECSEYVNFVEKFTRFTLFKYDWEQKKYYLIKQDFEIGQGCFEGYNPQKITVAANALNANSGAVAANTAWQFSAEGALGAVAEYPFAGLYKVDMPGCCAAAPVAKYYSLTSGKFIMASTIRPLLLDLVTLHSQRYIAVEDNTAAARWDNVENIATIFLGNHTDNLQMVSVHSSDAEFNRDEWMVTQLNFTGKKAKDAASDANANEQTHTIYKSSEMSGLALQIVLTCRCERPELNIAIPLEADRLDIKHATISGADAVLLDNLPPSAAVKTAAAKAP
jgi:hypothetical protein